MRKIIVILTVFLFTFSIVNAQENVEKKEKKASFATQILHNSVAGFYPIFLGNFQTNKNYDVTIYSIFWTNGFFGNLETGSDLLLETGAGLGFKFLDNKLYFNPSLGIGSGKFSSDSEGTKIGESLIPNIYLNYQDNTFDFEGYLAYYKALRNQQNITTKDYLLHWMTPGVKVGKRVVLGAYYESFAITAEEDGDPKLLYRWLGGSIKLNFDSGINFRISAGATLDTDVGYSDEFYKVAAFIPLN